MERLKSIRQSGTFTTRKPTPWSTPTTARSNDADHTLLLEGAVHISQGTRNMSASKVLYNTVTGSAHAEGDVTMQFPSELHRKLATPRPLKIPKNGLTEPAAGGASPPQ